MNVALYIQKAVDLRIQPEDLARTGESDERDLAGVTWFEANRGAGGNIGAPWSQF